MTGVNANAEPVSVSDPLPYEAKPCPVSSGGAYAPCSVSAFSIIMLCFRS
jgi:hypothetical protein